MNALRAKNSASRHALIASAAWSLSAHSCFPLISVSAAAQDYGHMRVQLSHGAAWTDTASQRELKLCCRPVRPMPVTAMPIKPKSERRRTIGCV